MNEKIYADNGYLNFEYILNNSLTYTFCLGGRGIGKTFGALKYVMDNNIKFIFMRRTQTQVDLVKSDDMSPFKALEIALGDRYRTSLKNLNKYITCVYRSWYDEEDGLWKPDGLPIGYMMALSTISNIRGFNAEDVDMVIYDEFIGEKHEKTMRDEGNAYLNAIETIARNRELQGKQPLRVFNFSNSTMLANPLFVELQLVSIAEKMLTKENQNFKNIPERALTIILLDKSPISEKKEETSLYKLATKYSNFYHMSINNDFTNEEMLDIKSVKLIEYKPLVNIGEITIYKHKSRKEYYITGHRTGTIKEYETGEMELKRFSRDYYYLWSAYLTRKVIFESYIYKVLFEKYFGIS